MIQDYNSRDYGVAYIIIYTILKEEFQNGKH